MLVRWSARDQQSQKVTDHRPVVTNIPVPKVKIGWNPKSRSSLDGWYLAVGKISIEDTRKSLPEAARAATFERRGGRSQLVKRKKEHIEAEKN